MIERLVASYKRGKFFETIYGKFSNILQKSESSMKKAVATKYYSFLSRRKYKFICKIQKSTYDTANQNWIGNRIEFGEYNLNLRTMSISHGSVDAFVKNLDIGEIHQIPGYSGACRTITALTTTITELVYKVDSYRKNLIWFNGNENHFVVEFSDDGAPESRESTMSIGTLSLWNFGNRIRSRDFHYPLHLITASEKEEVCANLWYQHCEEMLLIESNVLTIDGQKVTFEFQPSADQAWQHWAANCLSQSATYPSPYANVHKADLNR